MRTPNKHPIDTKDGEKNRKAGDQEESLSMPRRECYPYRETASPGVDLLDPRAVGDLFFATEDSASPPEEKATIDSEGDDPAPEETLISLFCQKLAKAVAPKSPRAESVLNRLAAHPLLVKIGFLTLGLILSIFGVLTGQFFNLVGALSILLGGVLAYIGHPLDTTTEQYVLFVGIATVGAGIAILIFFEMPPLPWI